MEPTQKRIEQETKAWAKPPSDLENLRSANEPLLSQSAEGLDPVVYAQQLAEQGADGDA